VNRALTEVYVKLWLDISEFQVSNLFLHHDKALVYREFSVKLFMAKEFTAVPKHSPYSPDFAPSDFDCFKNKVYLEGNMI
jgi:hypothetical protein